MPAARDAARVVALLAGYTAVVAWLTWPLATALSEQLPCTQKFSCTFDTLYSAWAVSWVSHALSSMPFHMGAANIYHPAPDALYYGPAALGAVPYALPVYLATGSAVAAINVAFLACVVLTAVALHWVVWRWTGSTVAGVVAAWTLLMNRWFLWGFVGVTPHLAAIQYLPLIVFLAARPLDGWRPALALLLVITLQCLTDPVYVAAGVLAPLGVLALARIVRGSTRASGWRLLAVLAGSLVSLTPLLLGYARVRAANPGLARQSVWANDLPVRSADGIIPNDLQRLLQLLWRGAEPITLASPILGLIAVGALVAMARRWRGTGAGLGHAWRHAGLWALVGSWISVTPILTVGDPSHGGWRLYLPQYLLAPLGFYQVVRVPQRLGIIGMIGLCLLAGVSVAELVRAMDAWLGRYRALVLAVAVAALAYRLEPARRPALSAAYPLRATPSTDPHILDALRASAGPVLELPAINPRTKWPEPRWHVLAMYRSTFHWRPLLNGYSSYWPAGFYERMQMAELLPAASALRSLVCETGLRTIVVDRVATAANRATWSRTLQAPPKGLRLVAATSDTLVFDVTMPPSGEPGGPDCDADASQPLVAD